MLIAPGVYRRRGALPRPPDRVQVLGADQDIGGALRQQVLEQFRPAARRLAR